MTAEGKPGASLRAWRDYFPNAHIYGLDIDEGCLFQESRITTRCVDQTDRDSVRAFWESFVGKEFDIIVDDGLHKFEAGVIFFEESFPHLREGGIYVIEDIRAQDLVDFGEYFASRNIAATFISMPRLSKLGLEDNALIMVRKTKAW